MRKHASADALAFSSFKDSGNFKKIYDEEISVSSPHGKNTVVVDAGHHNNRDDFLDRNKGYSMQRKMEVMNEFGSELKNREPEENSVRNE